MCLDVWFYYSIQTKLVKPRYLDEMQGIVLWTTNPVYKYVHGWANEAR